MLDILVSDEGHRSELNVMMIWSDSESIPSKKGESFLFEAEALIIATKKVT
jgi:hypothetical protein